MEIVIEFFENYSLEAIMVLSAVVALLILINLIIIIRLNSKINRYKKQIERSSNATLERGLFKASEDINKLQIDQNALRTYIDDVNKEFSKAIQKVGYIRYDAFNNQGSKLSFSIALLNKDDEGILITSIYTNGESISYSKYIKGDSSDAPLSAEEMVAIDRAKKYKQI